MWEDILTKDTILDLISKFIFVEVKEKVDEETGKVKRSENLIFHVITSWMLYVRYWQMCVRMVPHRII